MRSRGTLNLGADEAAALASQGNVIPLVCELPGDLLTPVGAFLRVASGREHAFLLESVEGGERVGRYSFLGCDPWMLVSKARVAPRRRDGESGGSEDPLGNLRKATGAFRPVHVPDLPPFTGGAVGWLAYDAVRGLERLPDSALDDLEVPDIDVALYDTVIAFDRVKQRIQIVANLLPGREGRSVRDEFRLAEERIASIAERLMGPLQPADATPGPDDARGSESAHGTAGSSSRQSGTESRTDVSRSVHGADYRNPEGTAGDPALQDGNPGAVPPISSRSLGGKARSALDPTLDRASFERCVREAKQEIARGEIFQVVLSRRVGRRFDGDPFSVYRALRAINPSPYNFYLRSGARALAGASPEMLVRVQGGTVETRPIAGTRRRGANDVEDARLEQELVADPKERAEHLMLVDLGRNDVGRIAAPGSVRVRRFAEIERYSHVMHLVSSVEGKLREGCDSYDALLSCFPAGTVSGAPKVRAMEIIDALEPVRRGAYAGAVFYRGFDGALDSAIAIRVILLQEGCAFVQAGAGIVADSDPSREFEETEEKARAGLSALERAEGTL